MCRDFGFWILDFGLGTDFGHYHLTVGYRQRQRLFCWRWELGVGSWEGRRVNVLFPQSKIQNPAWCAKLSGNPNSTRIRKIQNPYPAFAVGVGSWELGVGRVGG
jgi:hypothetical protein